MRYYGKLLKLKKGLKIQISLTFRCQFDCEYCTQKMVNGKRPKTPESNYYDWFLFFERFPYKIKEVYVSGGEPTLHCDFIEIVKYLLDKDYFVKVFTNLYNISKLLELPKSKKLMFTTTYHHSVLPEDFKQNYEIMIKSGYQIKVDEIGTDKYFKFSHLKPMITEKEELKKEVACLRVTPDLKIKLNCYELQEY